MKKIIIFGATGFIGTYTIEDLIQRGYEIVAVGHRLSDNGYFNKMGIKYYSIDIAQKESFAKLPLCNFDAVLHFAGAMPGMMEGYYPHRYVQTIVEGTLNVLEYTMAVSAKKIIFAQSRTDSNYLMGKTPIPSDIEKKFPLASDHSIYSICKNAAVDMIEHFYYQYGIKRFVLRLPTIYGYHPNPYFYVDGARKRIAYRYIIDKALLGEPVELWGNPDCAKEIVYVKDAVQVIRLCLESSLDGGMYNVGRGVPVSLREQIEGIVKVFSPKNNPSVIIPRPDKPDAREYVNDISKTQKDLGYKPEYDYYNLLIDYKKYMENEPMKLLWGTKEDYD